jgi:competence protein ComEC
MTATVSCVDVGQGDCTVAVDAETGEGLLIDCREGRHRQTVDEFDRLGLTDLRVVIVSHSQADHFGGVLDVLEELRDRYTGTLYFNHDTFMATPVAGPERTAAGRKLRALLIRTREFGDRVGRAEIPAQGAVGSIVWTLLAPTYAEIREAVATGNPNLASGVVLLEVGVSRALIGGDAQWATWDRIKEALPKECVVRWPHHGGSLGPDPDAHRKLLELLKPSAVLVSVGSTNGFGHPSPVFFAAARRYPVRLLCTQATSACVLKGGAGGVCAGSIRITLDGVHGARVEPNTANHAEVIAAFGQGQCVRPLRAR